MLVPLLSLFSCRFRFLFSHLPGQLTRRLAAGLLGTVVVLAGSGAAVLPNINFGNYPIYIGSRAGTSLFFNGRMYGLIIRGAQSTAAQITSGESYENTKAGTLY